MKKIIITTLALSVLTPITHANAECGAGYGNAVEINATTKVVTYSCVKLQEFIAEPIKSEPIASTHKVEIQTANQSIGFSGSLETVTNELTRLTTAPQAPLADPCVLGNCTKVEVNATTGVTTVLPLSLDDLAQRYKDAQFQYQRSLELAQAAQEALIVPIQPIQPIEPIQLITISATIIDTETVKSASITTKKIKTKTKKRAAIK
jgi:hypothetical protein